MIKVLIMEDDPDQALTLHDILSKAGCAVDITYSGSEAFMMLKARPFDILVTDMQVQGPPGGEHNEGGLELIIRARRAEAQGGLYNPNKRLRIIAVTGSIDYGQDRLSRAGIFGADAMVLKPISTVSILKALDGPVSAG